MGEAGPSTRDDPIGEAGPSARDDPMGEAGPQIDVKIVELMLRHELYLIYWWEKYKGQIDMLNYPSQCVHVNC
ncbi:MAG: hypothetical protein PF542_05160 [Nanoarchaeota archaeon]|jgi:hypothetical protein|nr:hypothetical protein [Nanoarchaeota archaeon]